AASILVLFNHDQFHRCKKTCRQIMTQHGDGKQWVSDDQTQCFLMDVDLLNPCTMIQHGEQNEATRAHMRFHFRLVRFPTFKLCREVVDHQWSLTDVGQQCFHDFVETPLAVESDAYASEGDFARLRGCHRDSPATMAQSSAIGSTAEMGRALRSWT